MVRFIIPSEEVYIPNYVAGRSDLIKEKLQGCDREDNKNFKIKISAVYGDAINNYLEFLDSSRRFSLKTLYKCFLLESYLFDHDYFLYLMQMAYDNWMEFEFLVEKFPKETQWKIYLYTPYNFIPDEYTHNLEFLKGWISNDYNKGITISGNDTYQTEFHYSAGNSTGFTVYWSQGKVHHGKIIGVTSRGLRCYLNSNIGVTHLPRR